MNAKEIREKVVGTVEEFRGYLYGVIGVVLVVLFSLVQGKADVERVAANATQTEINAGQIGQNAKAIDAGMWMRCFDQKDQIASGAREDLSEDCKEYLRRKAREISGGLD